MPVMATDLLKVLSYLFANITDMQVMLGTRAYSIECYSCMSDYLERGYPHMEWLYKRPLTFTSKCDKPTLDVRYLKRKNCSDMCIELRLDDKFGGMRRHGWLRGCISDVLNYNRTALRPYTYRKFCSYIRMKDLFQRGSSPRYGFAEHDMSHICSCHSKRCNKGNNLVSTIWWITVLFVLLMV